MRRAKNDARSYFIGFIGFIVVSGANLLRLLDRVDAQHMP